jgi:hypothetical protein
MNGVFLLVLLVVVVAGVAFALRRMSEDAPTKMPEADAPAPGARDVSAHEAASSHDDDEEEEDDEDAVPGLIAVSSDGLAFVPRARDVLVTPASEVRRLIERQRSHTEDASALAALPAWHEEAGEERRGSVHLQPGDLIAARVRRGAPDLDPWRLETLGRDRDLSMWSFETHEAADAARESLERLVVRPPFDEQGELIPIGDEDFWAAERELERTLQELDAPDEDDDAPESRR